MALDTDASDLSVLFEGEIGDVTDAEVQLIESVLGDLIQSVLLASAEKE